MSIPDPPRPSGKGAVAIGRFDRGCRGVKVRQSTTVDLDIRCGCTRHAMAHSTLSMSVMSISSSTAMIHFRPCLTRELAAWSADAASPSGAPFFSEMAKNCELAPMPSKKLTPTRLGHLRCERLEHGPLEAELANTRTLARRHLADERLEDRASAVRNGAHLEHELVILSTERSPRTHRRVLPSPRMSVRNRPFDSDFGSGGDEDVDRLGLHHFERSTVEGTGDSVLGLEELVHAAERQCRHGREAEDSLKRLAQRPRLVPVDSTVLAGQHHHTGTIGRLDHDAVRSDVVDAGLRIVGDPDGAAEIRRDVGTWICYRHGELIDSSARHDVTSGDHHLFHGCLGPLPPVRWGAIARPAISGGSRRATPVPLPRHRPAAKHLQSRPQPSHRRCVRASRLGVPNSQPLRSDASSPRNCQRTRGITSVSLFMTRVTWISSSRRSNSVK